MNETIDGYLTGLVQEKLDPGAVVVKYLRPGDKEDWVIRKGNKEETGIGINFRSARASIQGLIQAKDTEDRKRAPKNGLGRLVGRG